MNDQSWPAEKVYRRSVSKLRPYENNARTHSDAQIDQIVASIKEWGWTIPILVDENEQIIAGHGRVMAAEKMGLDKVPIMVAKGWSDEQKRAYVLADNQLALNAGWDDKILSAELDDLKDIGVDLSVIGFSSDDLAKLSVGGKGLVDEDETPEVPETPVAKYQDVWLLGNHRLMCGSSTSDENVEYLMAADYADMVFSDPPYNVDYSGRGANDLGKIKNDSMSDKEFNAFCDDFFVLMYEAMKPLACIYICHPDSQSAPKIAFEVNFDLQFKKSSTIIWVKQSAGMGWQDYRAQHEPILYGWKEGKGKHFNSGDRSKTTVWNIGRDAQASYVHPTQKPVALPFEAISNSSKAEDIILDLFGGSGSTLIACEKSNRRCYMMELDPKYCDVIINRWQNYTGEVATLDGKAFSEVEIERLGDGNGKGQEAEADRVKAGNG